MNQSSEGQFLSCQSKQNITYSNTASNFIVLLQDSQKFLSVFNEIYVRANLYVKIQKFTQATECFLKCCEMMEIGKNILKKESIFWPIVIYINLAYVYQNDWKIQKTNRYLQKAMQILYTMMNETSKQQKEEYLNLSLRLTKLKYQQCAVLSQLNQHDKALETCQSALPLLKDNIQLILDHAKKQYTLSQRQQNQYGVRFGVKVYSFAQEILNNLLAKMKVSCEASKLSTLKKASSMEFYYWQKNPQRNQKQLRNSFIPKSQKQQTAKRSILGVSKEKIWIDDFNIGYLMKISQTNISQWQKLTPFQEYFFKQKIYEYVIYASVGYFTMATQIRLTDNNKKSNPEQVNMKSKHEEIKKKYGYEEKTQQFALSQSHHLTAISIVTQNIQTLIPYLSHIIKSYDKHYIFKKNLDQIIAIPQQSILESKLSGIKIASRTVSKTSILGRSLEKQSQLPLTRETQIEQQDYGCSHNQNFDKKSVISSYSDSQSSSKNVMSNYKNQRKSFNQLRNSQNEKLSHSMRHKTTLKSKTAQKLSQTLKPKPKSRKIFTQQSMNELINSIGSIEKKSTKRLTKSKHTSKKQIQPKIKDKLKQKTNQKMTSSTSRQNKNLKGLKNNLKQKSTQSTQQGERQTIVKHKSCTNIKLVFKKKKAQLT